MSKPIATGSVAADEALLKDFLEEIGGVGWRGLYVTSGSVADYRSEVKGVKSRVFSTSLGDASQMAMHLARWGRDHNCYVSVSVVGVGGRHITNFVSARYVMLDDVGTKVSIALVEAMLGPPMFAVETSPGNYQYWYRLAREIVDAREHEALMTGLLGLGVSDRAGVNPVRLGRLPFGVNGKAEYGDPPPRVRLAVDNRGAMGAGVGELSVSEMARLIAAGLGGRVLPDRAAGDDVDAEAGVSPSPLTASVDDPDDVLRVLDELGWIVGQKTSGVVEVVCPFADEHSSGIRDGGWYSGGHRYGCFHASCEARGSDEFLAAVRSEADRRLGNKYGGRNCFAVEAGLGSVSGVSMPMVVDPSSVMAEPLRDFRLGGFNSPVATVGLRGRVVFVTSMNKFYDRATGSWLSHDQFNAVMAGPDTPYGRRGASSSSAVFLNAGGCDVYDDVTWWPGRGPEVADEGKRKLNTWSRPVLGLPPVGSVGAGDPAVQMYLAHVLELAGGDLRLMEWFLDPICWAMQRPGEKLNYCTLIVGEAGIGKDLLFEPMLRFVGKDNYRTVGPSEIMGAFNAGWLPTEVLIMNELFVAEQRAASERCKPITTAPPHYTNINQKGLPVWRARNTWTCFATANSLKGLLLDYTDRRFMVIVSDARPRSQAEGEAHFGPLWDMVRGPAGLRLIRWLLDRDISHVNPAIPPMRLGVDADENGANADMLDAKRDLLVGSMTDVGQWIADLFDVGGEFEKRQTITVADVLEVGQRSTTPRAIQSRISGKAVATTLTDLGWHAPPRAAQYAPAPIGKYLRIWTRRKMEGRQSVHVLMLEIAPENPF